MNELINDIKDLLTEIETYYPEVYNFLDEDPVTVHMAMNGEVTDEDLKEFLEGLREKLQRFKESHQALVS